MSSLFETLMIVGQMVALLVMLPIRAVLLPFETLWRWLRPAIRDDVEDDFDVDIDSAQRIHAGARWLFSLAAILVRAPLVWIGRIFAPGRLDWLHVFPALAMLGFMAYVAYQVFIDQSAIQDRYRQGAYQAVAAGDFAQAKTYFTRLIDDGPLSPREQMMWFTVLAQTGATQEAATVLNRLAPESGPTGYGPAHRIKALQLTAALAVNNRSADALQSQAPSLLKRLKWHLERCEDDSLEIAKSWAVYYGAIGEIDAALEKLGEAAGGDPDLWFAVADMAASGGQEIQRTRALLQAKSVFQKKLDDDLFDVDSRTKLAKVLVRMEKFDDAQALVLEGMKIQPNVPMRRAAAGFYVAQYDRLKRARPESFQLRFDCLQHAIDADPSHATAYERMTELFLSETTDAHRDKIRNGLMECITGDQPSPLAHFALSNFLIADGQPQQAQWHLEQAYRMDGTFVSVINNLAWVLAHRSPPDLDRALHLAQEAVQQAPENAEYLDTLGTVYMLRSDYDAAIVNLEKSLPKHRSKNEIHVKLAKCYRAIGRPEMAVLHEEKP